MRSPTSFSVAGRNYKAAPLAPKRQMHIARRLFPLLSGAFVTMIQALRISGGGKPLEGATEEEMRRRAGGALLKLLDEKGEEMVGPFLRALGSMSDGDLDFIVDECLKVTAREVGGGWQVMMSPEGQLQYADLELPEMLQITWKVIQAQLLPFISALQQS
jgi:hypothetical protein